MSLPAAQPAEVLRSWQKDDLYEKKFSGSIGRLFPPQHAAKALPAAALLYRSFTTLKDLQTLGEEYSGIIQVDETYNKLPSLKNRLLSILLAVFGENLCIKILRSAEKSISNASDLRLEAQFVSLVLIKSLCDMVPQFESIHRALCYIHGGPIQLSKSITKIDYVQVRPAAAGYYAHLRLLGVVTLAHAVVMCGQSIFKAKRLVAQANELVKENDNASSCVACLENLAHPCVLPCGHLFCYQCSFGALVFCALCRSPFTKNLVVPLQNYSVT